MFFLAFSSTSCTLGQYPAFVIIQINPESAATKTMSYYNQYAPSNLQNHTPLPNAAFTRPINSWANEFDHRYYIQTVNADDNNKPMIINNIFFGGYICQFNDTWIFMSGAFFLFNHPNLNPGYTHEIEFFHVMVKDTINDADFAYITITIKYIVE